MPVPEILVTTAKSENNEDVDTDACKSAIASSEDRPSPLVEKIKRNVRFDEPYGRADSPKVTLKRKLSRSQERRGPNRKINKPKK